MKKLIILLTSLSFVSLTACSPSPKHNVHVKITHKDQVFETSTQIVGRRNTVLDTAVNNDENLRVYTVAYGSAEEPRFSVVAQVEPRVNEETLTIRGADLRVDRYNEETITVKRQTSSKFTTAMDKPKTYVTIEASFTNGHNLPITMRDDVHAITVEITSNERGSTL